MLCSLRPSSASQALNHSSMLPSLTNPDFIPMMSIEHPLPPPQTASIPECKAVLPSLSPSALP